MRFIRKWSFAGAKYLADKLGESHEKRRVYYFGFQVILGSLVKGIILIGVSLILGTFVPAMIIFAVFAGLRIFAGGTHMDTYGKCLFVSLCLFITASLIARYTWKFWNLYAVITLVLLSFIMALAVIARWAPRDTPHRLITKPEEKRKFKRFSFVYAVLWLMAMGLITFFRADGYQMYVVSASLGLVLEIFSVTPAGYAFFGSLNRRMSGAKQRNAA